MIIGLAGVHEKGIMHRDLKPENVFVNVAENAPLDGDSQAIIGDFGSSRKLGGPNEVQELSEYVVTRWYRAPEIILSRGQYSTAIDIWSLGTIIYEMITLKGCFQGDNETEIIQEIINTLGNPDERKMIDYCDEDAIEPLLEMKATRNKTFASERFYTASQALQDLVRSCLKWNPFERPSAQELLQNPIFKKFQTAYELSQNGS